MKQNRERWETWKVSLEKLLASCTQEAQATEIRYVPHPNTNHLYQPTWIVLKGKKAPQHRFSPAALKLTFGIRKMIKS